VFGAEVGPKGGKRSAYELVVDKSETETGGGGGRGADSRQKISESWPGGKKRVRRIAEGWDEVARATISTVNRKGRDTEGQETGGNLDRSNPLTQQERPEVSAGTQTPNALGNKERKRKKGGSKKGFWNVVPGCKEWRAVETNFVAAGQVPAFKRQGREGSRPLVPGFRLLKNAKGGKGGGESGHSS